MAEERKQNSNLGTEGVNCMMGRLNLLADETEVLEMSDDEELESPGPEIWSLDGKGAVTERDSHPDDQGDYETGLGQP